MQNIKQKPYYLCRKVQGPLPAASHPKEKLEEEKHDKIMQLIIEELKFKAESEWDERKIGMLEQELTMNIEKLKAETKHSN